jgi:hypothetical protein
LLLGLRGNHRGCVFGRIKSLWVGFGSSCCDPGKFATIDIVEVMVRVNEAKPNRVLNGSVFLRPSPSSAVVRASKKLFRTSLPIFCCVAGIGFIRHNSLDSEQSRSWDEDVELVKTKASPL